MTSKTYTQCEMISHILQGEVGSEATQPHEGPRRGGGGREVAASPKRWRRGRRGWGLAWSIGLALLSVVGGCLSNPTPHPIGPDGALGWDDDAKSETTTPDYGQTDATTGAGDAADPNQDGPDGGGSDCESDADGGLHDGGGPAADGGDGGASGPGSACFDDRVGHG